jgi:hypothetical protein
MILALPLMIIIIGIPIEIFLVVLEIVCIVIASVKASKGERYKYPITIPFIQ